MAFADSTDDAARLLHRRLEQLVYAGVLALLLVAAVYLVGYVSVAAMAHQLGVAQHDLGFGAADYLFVPVWPIALWATITAAIFFIAKVGARVGSRLRRVHYVILLVFVVAALYLANRLFFDPLASASHIAWLLVSGFSVLSVVVGVATAGRARRNVIAVVLAAVLLTTVVIGVKWAEDVRAYAAFPAHRPSGWATPGRAINPQTGQACWGSSECKCVVRIGDRILLGIHGSVTVKEINEFRPGACTVVDHA